MRCGGLLLLLAALPALAARHKPSEAARQASHDECDDKCFPGRAPGGGPAFAARQRTAVAARVGGVAEMRCRVLRLADRAVSWVRTSDLQILTHAGAVFTADARVSCSEEPWDAPADLDADFGVDLGAERDWDASGSTHTLRLERLRAGDAGRYECQVNTEPKLSLAFELAVVDEEEPRVWLRAAPEVSGRMGGAAQLACEARYQPAPRTPSALAPLRIRWLRGGEALDTQSPRGGVSLEGERWEARSVSRLSLARLRADDAGRYTCEVAGHSAHVTLRVLEDDGSQGAPGAGELEHMQRDQAAAHTGAAAPLPPPADLLLLLLSLLLLPGARQLAPT